MVGFEIFYEGGPIQKAKGTIVVFVLQKSFAETFICLMGTSKEFLSRVKQEKISQMLNYIVKIDSFFKV